MAVVVMMTIVEFLAARLDEDEAVAREVEAALRAELKRGSFKASAVPSVEAELTEPWMEHVDGNMDHPTVGVGVARVLAEVEAKRRLMDHAETVSGMDLQIEREWGSAGSVPWDEDEGVRILRFLALPYADHPDYREEWTP